MLVHRYVVCEADYIWVDVLCANLTRQGAR